MAQVGIKELLEAGVHFGHQTRRWNPKMRRFIFGERAGIYIIDLQQTILLVEDAHSFRWSGGQRGASAVCGARCPASVTVQDTTGARATTRIASALRN